jgi:hypothetical protein
VLLLIQINITIIFNKRAQKIFEPSLCQKLQIRAFPHRCGEHLFPKTGKKSLGSKHCPKYRKKQACSWHRVNFSKLPSLKFLEVICTKEF